MEIILNETEWAREAIASRDLGRRPFNTMKLVARYYMDDGRSKAETRRLLEDFLLRCDAGASLAKWSDALDLAVRRAAKSSALQIDYIVLTVPEVDAINSLSMKQERRLAFTLLCLSKYWDSVRGKNDHWVNSKDCDIMKMANINTSVKRQCQMFRDLREQEYICFSRKVSNTHVRVLFNAEGDEALRVSDFRNLGNQYMLYSGATEFLRCENCGLVVRRSTVHPKERQTGGRPQKYCPSCASEIKIKGAVDPVMRRPEDRVTCGCNSF